jgi:hypothetical protein
MLEYGQPGKKPPQNALFASDGATAVLRDFLKKH